MLNTTLPSFKMLALPISRFTSAGEAQSALSTCRYHAKAGSRASLYFGLLSTKCLTVRRAPEVDNLFRIGKLKRAPAADEEIVGLPQSAEDRPKDAVPRQGNVAIARRSSLTRASDCYQ